MPSGNPLHAGEDNIPSTEDEETGTRIQAVRHEEDFNVELTGRLVNVLSTYSNRVTYKYHCISSTTLGPQILKSACWDTWIPLLNKLKYVEIFCQNKLMPSLYLLNLGLIIYIWVNFQDSKYNAELITPDSSYYYSYYSYYNPCQWTGYYSAGTRTEVCPDDDTDDIYTDVDNSWMWYYTPFLLLAFTAVLVFATIDALYFFALDIPMIAAFDLSLCFKVPDNAIGNLNEFIEFTRTERLEIVDTDLENYALRAALEDTTKIKIMLYKDGWLFKYWSQWFNFMTPCPAAFFFWLSSCCGNFTFFILAEEANQAPVSYLWWNFLFAHAAALGLPLGLTLVCAALACASAIVNVVFCGLLSCLQKGCYDSTKKRILDAVSIHDQGIRMSYLHT